MKTVCICAALSACRGGPSAHVCPDDLSSAGDPSAALTAYAAALDEGRLEDAWALRDPSSAGSEEAFRARYASAAVRKARAAELRASASALHLDAPGAALVRQDGWKIVDAPAEAARELLGQFLAAAERGDFEAAYALLSPEWRGRYTPQSFRADFEAAPEVGARLARARAALAAEPRVDGAGLTFPIGEGRAVRLVREGSAFRVAALE